ncbi:MAG: response regulator [Oscillospiraceae bacterium]|nr:response regulator [Oscillospiraceae bacterium]
MNDSADIKKARNAVLIIHNLSEKRLSLRNAVSDFVRVYAVKSKNSAEAALKKAENIKLIISDLEMPDNSGYELLDFLLNSGDYGDIPVLIITESPQKEIVKKLEGYGNVAGVIGKPCDLKEFREMTAEILGINISLVERGGGR